MDLQLKFESHSISKLKRLYKSRVFVIMIDVSEIDSFANITSNINASSNNILPNNEGIIDNDCIIVYTTMQESSNAATTPLSKIYI